VTFIDTTVNPGTTYCYRAFAHDQDDVSTYSDEACGTSGVDGYTVTVGRTGTGAGTVTSSPAGIACGPTCSTAYPVGTAVTLTALPASGSVFSGWSGTGCTGTDPCTFAGNTLVRVTATFTKTSTPTTSITAPLALDTGVAGTPNVLSTRDLAADLLVTNASGDPTLVAASTSVRAQHLEDLRAAVAVLRLRAGLTQPIWTDAVLVPGVTSVKRLYVARGVRPPLYADAALTAGVISVRAVHVDELRASVRAIE
jgi:hypothetical protein